jgi:hypothetical protein
VQVQVQVQVRVPVPVPVRVPVPGREPGQDRAWHTSPCRHPCHCRSSPPSRRQ